MRANVLKNIYYINLDESVDRREQFEAEMAKWEIKDYTRFPAIKPGPSAKEMVYGNLMSHLGCIEIAKEEGHEYAIICEDDLEFDDKWMLHEVFFQLTTFIRTEKWEMIYLGGNYIKLGVSLEDTSYSKIKKMPGALGIHCYLVHNSIYDLILDNWKKYWQGGYSKFPERFKGSNLHCDSMFHHLIHTRGYSFMTSPRLALQRPGYSYVRQGHRDYYHVSKDY